MRVLHISDLHFGSISKNALRSIEGFIQEQQENIDLVVVTGDWTQRARVNQFRAAREFLMALPLPVLSVPGNHDVPLYNWVWRLYNPLKDYRRYIEPFTLKTYSNDEVAIWGLNTVKRFKIIEGAFGESEFKKAFHFFKSCPKNTVKVIACHHPLINPKTKKWISGLRWMKELRPDIILSGHSHLLSVEYQKLEENHRILSVVSGTSTSHRLRGEANSFHIVHVKRKRVEVTGYFLSTEGFLKCDENSEFFAL